MEITVLKCDRCKKEVEGLIEFSFINRNVEAESADENKHDKHSDFFSSFYGKPKQYPTISGGLCFDCIQELSRWLGHPENSLKEVIK